MVQNVQSVDRAMTMLWAIRRSPGRSLSELAEMADVAPSTALRLLTTLERHQLLDRDGTRRYHVGAGALRLAGITNGAHEEIRALLEPCLRELAGVVREQVAVAILEGNSQIKIAIVDGAREAGEEVILRPDSGQPHENLNATAVGKILLAYSPEETRDAIIAQLRFDKTAGHTITSAGRLRRHLVQVAKSGYATCIDENLPDVCGVAAPLRNRSGDVIAALCVNGPASRLPPDRLRTLLPLLQRTAVDCSQMLIDFEGGG